MQHFEIEHTREWIRKKAVGSSLRVAACNEELGLGIHVVDKASRVRLPCGDYFEGFWVKYMYVAIVCGGADIRTPSFYQNIILLRLKLPLRKPET